MPLILEDEGKNFGSRQIPLPDDLVKKLKERLNMYSGDEYRTSRGFKRLHALLNKDYNIQSDRKDRQQASVPTISFSDIKRIDFDIRHMPNSSDNPEYEMIGGDMMRDFTRNTLDSLRNSVTKVEPVPEVPKLSTKDVKPSEPNKEIRVGKVDVRVESRDFNDKIRKLY